MSDSFDPYRKWLGIPPEDQPPHHYRLLGLVPFESDPDVIVTAADGRLALLKRFQSGKYSALSQRLMNEVAAAKVCLLNDEKRAEYDDGLRKQLDEKKKPQPKAAPAGSRKTSGTTATVALPKIEVNGTSGSSKPRPPAKPLPWKLSLAILGVGAVLVGVVVALAPPANGKPDPQPPVVAAPSSKPDPVKPAAPADKPAVANPADNTTAPPEMPTDPPDANPTAAPVASPIGSSTLADLLPDKTTKPEPAKPDAADPTKPAEAPKEPAPAGKPAVPDEASRQAAEHKIRELFKKEFADAQKAEARLKLADTLLTQARQPDIELPVRYMLFQLAVGLTADAGYVAKSMDLIDELAEFYDIHVMAAKLSMLDDSLKSRTADTGPTVYGAALSIFDAAAAADDFDMAKRASKVVASAATRNKDRAAVAAGAVRDRDLENLKRRYVRMQEAKEKLPTSPDDPEANQIVGVWLCFAKGEWDKGLPHLAKGGDAQLAALAKMDLTAPEVPRDQVVLGDKWGAYAKTDKTHQIAIESHAADWYRKALPKLDSLSRKGVQDKLDQFALAAARAGGTAGGIVQPGNVALAANGAVATGTNLKHAEQLLDGNTTHFDPYNGFAWSQWPCEWTITLDKVYKLQEIRFRLYDKGPRVGKYRVEVSANGKDFVPVADNSGSSWQSITFTPRPVRVIKLYGLHDGVNEAFCVVELEAYCTPLK